MRTLSFVLIAISFVLVPLTITQEIEGKVVVYHRAVRIGEYSRQKSPKQFRQAMNFCWMRSIGPALLGALLLSMVRRQDRLDPSSPDFQGSQALDDLGAYLDQELTKKRQTEKPREEG